MADGFNSDQLVNAIISQAGSFENQFRFEGFNPRLMRTTIANKGGAHTKTDLPMLITLFCMRGTNLHKYKEKMSETGREMVNDLINRYSIPRAGVKLNRSTITLSRVAACFPDVVFRSMVEKPGIISDTVNLDDVPECPRVLVVPCFASTVPKRLGIITKVLLCAHFEAMTRLDRVIHTKDGNYTSDKDLLQFQESAFNSPILSEEQRIDLFMSAGYLQLDGAGGMELTEAGEGFHTLASKNERFIQWSESLEAGVQTMDVHMTDESTGVRESAIRSATSPSTATKRKGDVSGSPSSAKSQPLPR